MPQFRLDEYLAERDAIPFTQDVEDIIDEDDSFIEEDREETPELVEELLLEPHTNLPRESMYVRMFGGKSMWLGLSKSVRLMCRAF